MIWAVVCIWAINCLINTDYCAEYLPVLYEHQWQILLGSEYLIESILLVMLLNEYTGKSLLIRSITALVAISSIADFIIFSAWHVFDFHIEFWKPAAIVFFVFLLFILKRKYPERIDLINMDNINILILKPRTTSEVIKSLFGYPAASICICSHYSVWSFRKKTNIFEEIEYNNKWCDTHLVIDTGIKCTNDMLIDLDCLVGKKRFPFVKCVWTVREILNKVGDKYAIKSWLDYIPGFYFMRII